MSRGDWKTSAVSRKFYVRFWQFDMLTKRINRCENTNIEIRTVFKASAANNIKIEMFEIQNKSGQLLPYSVLVIDTCPPLPRVPGFYLPCEPGVGRRVSVI